MADPTSADRSRLQPMPLVPFGDRSRLGASLPVWLTSFVGREREIAEVCALLRGDARLVTLIGAGGVGKTRLAVRIATELAPSFADGVVFVTLASVIDPALVLPTVAQALGVREGGDRPLIERLGALLGDRHLLVVTDNLEHLVDAAPDLARFLASCPGVTVLATSRVVLRLSGEQVFPVLPLALPDATRPLDLAEISEHEALALFAQRARAADPGFFLTSETLPTVVEVVRRLDGLPLAIELAAARVRSLTPAALLARLSDRLLLLTGGARDLPERQRTMRDTIAWSYDLLTPEEQALFRRLAVFVGGFTLEAAEAVGAEKGQVATTLDLIASLVDQCLLQRAADSEHEPRYLMLETVREFALAQLEASGEAEAMRQRHADYFVGLAEATGPYLQWQRDTGASMHLLNADLDNLRAAVVWASERDPLAMFLRLVAALGHFWQLSGRLVEGRVWIDRAVGLCDAAPLPLRASVLREAAWFVRHLGDFGQAVPLGERALALSREHGDPVGIVHALTNLGWMAENQGQFARARTFHEEALELGRHLEDRSWTAFSLRNVGMQAFLSGEIETAERWIKEALALFRREGSRFGAAFAQSNLAEIALRRGEHARAAALWEELLGLTWNATGLIQSLEGLAEIAVAVGETAWAARLLGAAEAQRERNSQPQRQRKVREHQLMVADLREALGDVAFVAAWAEGRRLSPEEARAEAFRVMEAIRDATAPAPPAREADHGLTPREFEVLRLVANGRSDQEIAGALFIGPATVRTHLTNAFRKLDVGSRTAAVAACHRLGIL